MQMKIDAGAPLLLSFGLRVAPYRKSSVEVHHNSDSDLVSHLKGFHNDYT
jgi:hypothetical protein